MGVLLQSTNVAPSPTPDLDAALQPADAAAFLGVSTKTLANWRSLGQGPDYVKYHGRRVAYLRADLEAYRRANRVAVVSGGGR